MLKLLKLLLLIIILVTFFALTGFVYYDLFYLHLILLAFALILHSIRFSLNHTWQMIKLLLPFTITIFIFGLIFQLVHLQGRTDWLTDSLIKVIYFPASFIFTKFIISLFSYQDILDLPLSSELKTEIISLQVFIKKAFDVMPRLEFHLKNHPLMQGKKSFIKAFLLLCAFPLSLYIFLIEEGNMIRNIYLERVKHLEES